MTEVTRKMLSTPNAGWSEFTLGKFRISASYLTDIPFDWLRACISGLKYVIPASFFLDAEGSTCRIISDWCGTYIIFEKNGSAELTVLNRIGLHRFAEMLLTDIRNDLEYWIWWCGVSLTDEQYARRKAMLTELIAEAEQCLADYMHGSGNNF